jgi:tRNA pseudouridine55 synthase
MESLSTNGFLVVDKSAGMTSHDVVAIARRALGMKKIGHAGTLDPMATGVLVLGLGNGTRLLQYITEGDKSYTATMVLGASTVTDDVDGEVLSTAESSQLKVITDEQIHQVLATMRGVIAQRPSSVSAVKINGERAYARVRAGEEVFLPTKEVTISQLDIRAIRRFEERIEIDIEVTCSAGTFIRAIARDCGMALGVGGYLSVLRRTRVANFDSSQGITIEKLKAKEFVPLPITEVAASIFPVRELSGEEAIDLSFGRPLSAGPSPEITAAMAQGELAALLVNRDGLARPVAVFAAKS